MQSQSLPGPKGVVPEQATNKSIPLRPSALPPFRIHMCKVPSQQSGLTFCLRSLTTWYLRWVKVQALVPPTSGAEIPSGLESGTLSGSWRVTVEAIVLLFRSSWCDLNPPPGWVELQDESEARHRVAPVLWLQYVYLGPSTATVLYGLACVSIAAG